MENMEVVRRYVALMKEKKVLDNALAAVKKQIETAEQEAYDYLTTNGIQNIRVDDRTVYVRREIHATYLKTEEAQRVLEQLGLTDALTTTVHPSRASAIAREALDDDDSGERRAQLEKAFSIYEKFRVSVTR
jgi:hypothetical protein